MKKSLQLGFILLITMLVFQACKKKKCPDDLPPYLQNYINNYAAGKVILYKNQYNETIQLPPSIGVTYKDINKIPYSNDCNLECDVNTLPNDSLYFSLNIQGHFNDDNFYNYLMYIGLGNSDSCKKYFDFHYLDGNPPGGWPAANSGDSTKYHDNYLINGKTYSKVFQVILKDSTNPKPFFKQYFLNLEKGFIRFDEKYTDKIWVLN